MKLITEDMKEVVEKEVVVSFSMEGKAMCIKYNGIEVAYISALDGSINTLSLRDHACKSLSDAGVDVKTSGYIRIY